MSRVSAETPSKAQQSCVGTDSTKPSDGGLATAAGGAVRMTGPVGTLGGCAPSFCVAFIGESAMRAVSLRGPVGATPRAASGLAGGKTGLGGGGFTPAGGGGGGTTLGGGGGGSDEVAPGGGETGAFARGGGGSGLLAGGGAGGSVVFVSSAGGGPAGFPPLGKGGVGGLKLGGGRPPGGRTPPGGACGGGALYGPGGRTGGVPPAGANGFGEIDGGGRKPVPGCFAPAGGAGGRLGRLIRAVSFSTGTVGRLVVRGGKVMRTVSFFGSFRSAITRICSTPRERRQPVSQTPPGVSTFNRLRRANHSRGRPESFA